VFFVLLSLVFTALGLMVASEDFPGNSAETDEEGLQFLQQYILGCSFGLMVALVCLRGLTAVIYRSAVLKVLREGSVVREDLHPLLASWLERLDLMPRPAAPAAGLARAVRFTTRWSYRRLLYGLLFLTWIAFIARFYVGYFLVANGFAGFLNHPLVQLPCLDHVPFHPSSPD
jgi:hypothetical protein